MKRLFALAVLLLVLAPVAAQAQERGSITGQVIDQATRQPLAGAQVTVTGTNLGTLTNQQGRFVLPNVPVGPRDVRVTLIGYGQRSQSVVVAPGVAVTAEFEMAQSAVAIEGIIVTATGREERTRTIGNAVANISVAEIDLAPVTNMSQLLQARAPGVSVLQSGGTSGTGARVRIRGSNSVSLSNEPLLIIDGVRVTNEAQSSTIGIGGQAPSRLNDLNPEEIESIEILRGPAAAALYGTAAANGVVQVTTRRGRAGATRWSAYVEGGTIIEPTQYPANFGSSDGCNILFEALGECALADSEIFSFNPLMNPATTPFRDGSRQKYGVSVTGGTENITFFVSGDYENERGVYRNNELDRLSLRTNLNAALRNNLDLALRVGFVNNDIRLPQNDNNFLSPILLGMIGPADTTAAISNEGYFIWNARQVEQVRNQQDGRRFTASGNLNFRPLEWLSLVGTTGVDLVNRHDNQILQPGVIVGMSVANNEGYRQSNRVETLNVTNTLDATANFNFRPNLTGQSSVGVQYFIEDFRDTRAYGQGLTPGTGSLAGTTRLFEVGENVVENRTFGAYLQQQVGLNDRLFVTGAVRGDDNSAFGEASGFVLYPSISASWVVSEEPFFPQAPLLSNLRLRAAYGRSGLRPTYRDAITFFSPVAVRVNQQDVPGITLGTTTGLTGTGNPDLRPEIANELELGFDLGVLDDRLGVELTYYNKRSEDALIQRRLAPSIGTTTTRWENIGSVQNTGLEVGLRGQPVNVPNFGWDFRLSYSTNRNELLRLGEGIAPIQIGFAASPQIHREGFPLGGYWARPIISFNDDDGDGLLQPNEVVVGDTLEFRGSPFPTRELSFGSNFTLFNRVTLSGLLDYKGGNRLLNFTRWDRCVFEGICGELFEPAQATLENQAAYIGSVWYGTTDGYLEDASFLKLREVALTFGAPEALARRVGASGLRLTLAGRNLATWTGYKGLDPELNSFGQANFNTAEFYTQPPVRYFTARVDLNF